MNHAEHEAFVNRISQQVADLGVTFAFQSCEVVAHVASENLHGIAQSLREAGFDRLDMVTAVDHQEHFELVYRLQSRSLSGALCIKTRVPREEPFVASLVDIWPAADWQEREVFDLFGVVFEGHPDLRRILLPDGFEGYPLRRDYDSPRLIRRPDYI